MTIPEALTVLELALPQIRAASPAEAQAALQAWKDGPLKAAWRAKAKASHPDRGGTDEAVRRVLAARDVLDGLHIGVPRPSPPPTFVVVVEMGYASTAGRPTTTTTTWRWG